MKIYLNLLAFSLLMLSCQSKTSGSDHLNSIVEKQGQETPSKIQSHTILTEAQFTDFFPKELGGYKLINVSVLMSSAVASAMYIKDNDYNHSMTYSLEDCNRKGSANIRNFEDSYNLKPQGPAGTTYVYKVRDGYKTIAFLQPNITRNNIEFIYNNRFRIVLNGTADVDLLWTYFKKEDLQKLEN